MKNQTAVSTQIATCCCGTTQCNNSQSQFGFANNKQSEYGGASRPASKRQSSCRTNFGKQTAIDDLQSSYQVFKSKQEAHRDSNRKLKKALKMCEVLIRYYLREARAKSEKSNQ